MAPQTRLQKTPSLRVAYSSTGQERIGSIRNPIVVDDDTPSLPYEVLPEVSPVAMPSRRSLRSNPSRPAATQRENPATRLKNPPTRTARSVRGGPSRSPSKSRPTQGNTHVTKQIAVPRKTLGVTFPERKTEHEKPARKEAKKDCMICAETKKATYLIPEKDSPCVHFMIVCTACVSKMIKTQTSEGKVAEARLPCPVPSCVKALEHNMLEWVLPKEDFETWDKALATHLLRSDDNFIACLNVDCGRYFSKESCNPRRPGHKKEIQCPYCEYAMCLTCSRPWHGNNSCNKEKAAENKKSEAAIVQMGAKPCPKCGANIEKNGGCDHMTCNRCRHNFCFLCLVAYTPNMQHGQGCPHREQRIANDPGNWVNEVQNLDQVIEDLDAGFRRALEEAAGHQMGAAGANPIGLNAIRVDAAGVGAINAMQRMRAAMIALMPARPQQGPQNGNGQ